VTGSADGDAWARIEALLSSFDFTSLTLAVTDLSPEERRAVVAPLRRYIGPGKYDPVRRLNEAGVAIVGAGVLPDAKSVAAWLNRYGMRHFHVDYSSGDERHSDTRVVPNVFYVLTERGVPWLGELAAQIAERLPRTAYMGESRFDLVCRLLERTGQPVPTSAGFVAGWVHRLRPETIGHELAAHPEFGVLVPHFFDVEEVGAQFSHYADWPEAIAGLVARAVVDRDVLLDACLARLARGGRPGATRAFLAMHDALAPTPEEVAGRSDAYRSLLDSTASMVASAAQRSLFDVDDRGLLSSADQLAITRASLRRPEKKLVRAQLTRARSADPSRAVAVAAVLVEMLPDLAPDLARSAVSTLRGIRASIPEPDRASLLSKVAGVPRDLATELGLALGGTPTPVLEIAEPMTRPPHSWRPETLEPITDLSELVVEAAAVFVSPMDVEASRLERVLEGLLHWQRRDMPALRKALEPTIESERFAHAHEFYEYGYHDTLDRGFAAVLAAAAGEPPVPRYTDIDRMRRGAGRILVDRLFELARTMRESSGVFPVCRPTWSNGLLDGDDLLERLHQAAHAGVDPPDVELEQASLRLSIPANPDARASLAEAFGKVGTAAGRSVAAWITGRLPVAPSLVTVALARQRTDFDGQVKHRWTDILVAAQPSTPPQPGSVVWSGLVRFDPATTPGAFDALGGFLCVPWLAPQHRELIAAHFLPSLAASRDGNIEVAPVLRVLADIDGEFGTATALALTYGLTAARADARTYAVEAIRTFSARRLVDADVLGRTVADLSTRRTIVMTRFIGPLRDVANAGEAQLVWDVLRNALPDLLRTRPLLPGLADVLGLAGEVAERVHANVGVSGLDDFTAHPGRSRQLAEARRLAGLLSR
jgi:hypothetical protein